MPLSGGFGEIGSPSLAHIGCPKFRIQKVSGGIPPFSGLNGSRNVFVVKVPINVTRAGAYDRQTSAGTNASASAVLGILTIADLHESGIASFPNVYAGVLKLAARSSMSDSITRVTSLC